MPIDIAPDPSISTKRILEDTLVGCIQSMRAASDNAQRFVWANPYDMTPQQVLDLLGTDAGATVQLWYQMAALINGSGITNGGQPLQVTGLMPEGTNLQFNADGTITVVTQ
jgi:hypothetical protein